jgi:hypothetical protein
MNKISQDNLVEILASDPNNLETYTMLSGYLGKSSRKEHYRLYDDLSFSSYIDFKESDVQYTKSTESTDNPFGTSFVWLSEDAKVIAGGQQKMDAADLAVFQGGFMSEMDELGDELNIDGGGNGIMAKPKSRYFRTSCGIICRIVNPRPFKTNPIIGRCPVCPI